MKSCPGKPRRRGFVILAAAVMLLIVIGMLGPGTKEQHAATKPAPAHDTAVNFPIEWNCDDARPNRVTVTFADRGNP